MWNNDDELRGRPLLLSPEREYMNLMDFDSKYEMYLSRPQLSKPGVSSFQIWKEQILGHCRDADYSFYKIVPGIHLIDMTVKYQFMSYSKTNERYGLWTEHFDEYAHQTFCIYEEHVAFLLNSQPCQEIASIFRKRITVFQTMKMGRDSLVAFGFLMRVLYDMHTCNVVDDALIVSLIEATCITPEMKRFLFADQFIKIDDQKSISCTQLIKTARKCSYDFWGVWSSDLQKKHEFDRFCPVLQAFFLGNEKMMKMLLSFGFHIDLRAVPQIISLDFFIGNFGLDENLTSLPAILTHRAVLMCCLFRFVHHPTLRPLWETRSVYGNVRVELPLPPVPRSDLVQCLDLFWKSYQGSFMDRAEFLEVASQLFNGHPDCMAYAEIAYDVYTDLTPKYSQSGPRSLLHNSRCIIRKELHRCRAMPEGIQHLDIPTNLKSYLMLGS